MRKPRAKPKKKPKRWVLPEGKWAVFAIFVGILAVMGLMLVVITITKIVRSFACDWRTAAQIEAAEAAIGSSPSVASILSGRAALHDKAREQGVGEPKLFAAIERRVTGDGRTIHVAALVMCVNGRHADVERVLPRLLTAEELAALAREGIEEHEGTQWKRHHDHRRR